MTRERYPLGLCLAAIVATSLGLTAAALGIKWGAAPAPGDALRNAWLYVHLMAAFTWLLVWPAAALRPSQRELLRPRELVWSYAAIWIGMLPAVGVSALLAATPAYALATALAVELAISVFVLGVLALAGRLHAPTATALLAMVLAMVAVMGPIAGFVWLEFFPHVGR